MRLRAVAFAGGAMLAAVGAAAASDDVAAIPAGHFVRGRVPSERHDDGPAHDVAIHAFAIDKTLVTRAAFAAFVGDTGYKTTAETIGYGMASWDGMNDWEWERVPNASWRRPFKEGVPGTDDFLRDDAPVVMVTYFDAEAYCAHAGKRLPTEAEWEYAMRAGSAARFPWGDSPERSPGKLGLNFFQGTSHRKNLKLDGFLYVSPVHAFPPNAWGIYDPVGNVWQWTKDWYAIDTYVRAARKPPVVDPQGPAQGTQRVLRGGSWWCGACTCEGYGLDYRGHADPGAPFDNNGFRCAITVRERVP